MERVRAHADWKKLKGPRKYNRLDRGGEDVYVVCAQPLHILRSHYSLHAAMQAGCMVEWIHHLRTIFEVH